MRGSRTRRRLSKSAVALQCALLACGCKGAAARRENADPLVRGSLMLTLEDGDLPPGVYADGRIVGRDPDARDTLTALQLPVPQRRGDRQMPVSQILAPNSAFGSASSLALSRNGLRAIVATTHASAAPSSQRAEELQASSELQLIDVALWPPKLLDTAECAPAPVAASFHPSGERAAIACRATGRLTLAVVQEQRFGPLVIVDLAGALGIDCEPSGVAWSPDGSLLCVTTGAPGTVSFWRVDLSTVTQPVVEQVGRTLQFGAYLRSPHWTLEGQRVVVADVGWPSASSGVYILDPEGGVHLVGAPVGDAPARLLHSSRLVPAPQAIALDPAGRTVASVAMRRQDLFAGSPRLGGIVSTLRVDPRSLQFLGSAPCGPLPHDAAFSSDGRDVVVAEFSSGSLEIFRLGETGAPVFTGVRIETGFGLHQVVITP